MQRLFTRNHVNFLTFPQRLLPFSTSSLTTVSDSFANYLVDSLGFSHQQALSASTRLSKYRKVNDFNFDANATSVITFFRLHGFDDTHISKIVSTDPRLLTYNVDNTLFPKFKFFQDQGFSNSDLTCLISANPSLLQRRIDSSILPVLGTLRQFLGCDTLVIAALRKLHSRKCRGIVNNMMPNVDFLITYGIPIKYVIKFALHTPNNLIQNPEKLKERVIRVENKLGIARNHPMFVNGIHLLSANSEEAIESKCRIFKSFGWTQTDVYTFMMKMPSCFAYSEASIKKKLEFLMNELQLKPDYVLTRSQFFTYSLEKRIVPRHKLLLILKEKGLLRKNSSLCTAVGMTDSRFLKKFVIPFKEVHQVYAKLTGCSMRTLTQLDCKFQESLALPVI